MKVSVRSDQRAAFLEGTTIEDPVLFELNQSELSPADRELFLRWIGPQNLDRIVNLARPPGDSSEYILKIRRRDLTHIIGMMRDREAELASMMPPPTVATKKIAASVEHLKTGVQTISPISNSQTRQAYREAAGEIKEEFVKHAQEPDSRAAMLDWIQKHGSEKLKLCISHNIKCDGIFKKEYVAFEFPRWKPLPRLSSLVAIEDPTDLEFEPMKDAIKNRPLASSKLSLCHVTEPGPADMQNNEAPGAQPSIVICEIDHPLYGPMGTYWLDPNVPF